MPAGRVYRQSYTAQHQFRPRFFATPDPIDGTLAELLDDITVAAAGASGAAGTLAETLDVTTPAASGTFGDVGTLAVTLGNTTSAATGGSGASGTLTETFDDATLAAAGTSTPPGVAGSLAATLADSTVAASGTFTDSTPPPSGGSSTKRRRPRLPRFSGGGPVGRNVHITATADLGRLTAQTTPRVELADEELIELL